MKRKVVKHGPSTHIISLPSHWVKQNKIKKGDELELTEEDTQLNISVERRPGQKKIEIDVSDLDRSSLMYVIRCLYKLGYAEIRLRFDEQAVKHFRLDKHRTIVSVVHEELNRLTGIEIVEQKTNSCVLKTLSDMKFEEFNSILRRVFLLLIDMYRDFMKGYETKNELLLRTLEEKHNGITKFISFCMRLLTTTGYPERRKNLIAYSILALSDKIVDSMKLSGRFVLEKKPGISKNTKQQLERILHSLELFYDFYYKYDNIKLQKQSLMRDKITKEMKRNYNAYQKDELMVLCSVMPIIENLNAMIEYRIAMEF